MLNGFGRIGRTILRQILDRKNNDVELVAINDIAPLDMCAYLFEYDSTFGPYPGQISVNEGLLVVDGRRIPFHQTQDLRSLDLSQVDVVLECTGIARTSDVARRGLEAGAGSVLISGPSPAAEVTCVLGANTSRLDRAAIVSNASCTTNAMAPLATALDTLAGIEHAHMTTVHCYTNSQPMVDAPRGDFARSRAGALSMVPTGSSAIQLLDVVLPHLKGRLTGAAIRVPTASVSAVDLVATVSNPPANWYAALRDLADMSPVMGWTDQPLVSSDLRGRSESLVLALPELRANGSQVRILGWYDNEWGFSARMLDMARMMAARQP